MKKTTIPASPGPSTPQAGTRQVAGKSNECDAVLRTGKQPKPVAVKTAQEVKGAARKAIDTQVKGDGGSNSPNGNPKKRNRSGWGVEEPKN
jgi:hypothetical protein